MQVISQRIPATILREVLQNILIGVILVFSVLLVLQQANPARSKLGRDSGAYIYIGSHILRGEPPYLTAWDSKPPGIFLLDAVGLWLGKGTRWGIWLIEATFLIGATIMGYLAMKKHFGAGPSLISSIVWHYGLNRILIGGNLTEEYALLFGFASLFFFSLSIEKEHNHWLYASIGFCAGSSFILRPNNTGVEISIITAITILMVLQKKYISLLGKLFLIGVGILVPLSALTIYLISQKTLQAFWDAAIIYNFFSYAGSHFYNPLGAMKSGIHYLDFVSQFALFGFFITINELWSHIKENSNGAAIFLWIFLNGILEVLLSGLSGRNYEHYFINWLPFVAFSSALFFARALPQLFNWPSKQSIFVLVGIIIILAISFQNVPSDYCISIQPFLSGQFEHAQYTDPVAEYISRSTIPEQTVLVWGGQAGINFMSRRDSPVAYLFFPLGVPSKITNYLSERYYRALISNSPELIIDAHIYDSDHIVPISAQDPASWLREHQVYNTPYVLEVLDFIQKNYALTEIIEGVSIYRLNQK